MTYKTTNSELFSIRQAYWTSQGKSGRDVFDQLAEDPLLPSFFDEPDLASICGLTTHAIKARRRKGMKPAYMKVSGSCIRYSREVVCLWLAEMLCNGDFS